MNMKMIKLLVFKDWSLSRKFLPLYVVGGLVGISAAVFGGELGLWIGSVGLVGMIMGVGIHLVFTTVVDERTQQTLPFVMSLPISIQDYTVAKILANMTAFMLPWFILSTATVVAIYNWADIPNGFIPFLTIMLLELAVCNFILLGTAIVTESKGWTIGVMSVCNAGFSIVFNILINIDGIGPFLWQESPVWNSTIYSFWLLEALALVLIFSMTFYFQGKKTDFI